MALCCYRLIMALLLLSGVTRRTAHSFSVPQQYLPRQALRSLAATRAPEAPSTTSTESSKEVPVIVLKRSRQSKAFRNGNQLVFKRAVQSGKAPTSALVQVAVQDDKQPSPLLIGWGVYNPSSLYTVRILCHRYLQSTLWKRISSDPDITSNQTLYQIVRHHLQMAVQKRKALNLPNPNTTTMYRLVNGEGDALSGLQIDVIDSHVVVQSSAGWCQAHKDIILQALQDVTDFDQDHIIWKVAEARLKQDGYPTNTNEPALVEEEDAKPVVALENGVHFQTWPALDGQKTGVYCDQRENRLLLSHYCQSKTVLDLCCFHGGFSLTALQQGGALSTVGVDSSAAAIQAAEANARLNDKCASKATFVKSDMTPWMQQAFQEGQQFDVVVLDPPKLAPTVSSLDRARRKYHGLNRDAIKLVDRESGGILMTCTCSAAMTQQEGGQYFVNMVAGAAQAAGREVTLLSKSGAASCHTESPVSWPAGAYLTAALFYVHPIMD